MVDIDRTKSAMIIAFPKKRSVGAGGLRSPNVADKTVSRPPIEWGSSRYHEAAVKADRDDKR